VYSTCDSAIEIVCEWLKLAILSTQHVFLTTHA
jgi:hypothetical protein